MKNKLKEIRMKEHLMAPGEFAKFLGVPIQTYSGWENGHSKPSLEKALEVSKLLEKKLEEVWYLE